MYYLCNVITIISFTFDWRMGINHWGGGWGLGATKWEGGGKLSFSPQKAVKGTVSPKSFLAFGAPRASQISQWW